MLNAKMQVVGNILTIVVDLSEDNGPSKSMKSTIIASSQGNQSIPGSDAKIGLNVYKSRN
jgi:hypothetical protein